MTQARSQGGQLPPIPKVTPKMFEVNKAFDVYAKEILQCKSTQLHKEPILFQLLAKSGQSSMVYQLSMVHQTLCTV